MTTTTAAKVHTHQGPGFTYYARWLARCPKCKAVVKLESLAELPVSPGWYVAHRRSATCSTCDINVVAKMVTGSHSNKECDARCMGAKGPNCECSCGGENHGCNS